MREIQKTLAELEQECKELRDYAGKQMAFSDYQNADQMREALNVLKSELLRAQAENAQLKADLDEARREVCELLGQELDLDSWRFKSLNLSPRQLQEAKKVAKQRNWDCFKESR